MSAHRRLPYTMSLLSASCAVLALLAALCATVASSQRLPATASRQSACPPVVFKGEARTFQSCDTALGNPTSVHVYYSLTDDSNSLVTLFRVTSGAGYVSLAWGYDQMIVGDGTHAVVATTTDIAHYVMLNRTSAGVAPFANDSATQSPYTDLQFEVSGPNLTGLFTRPLVTDGQLAIPELTAGGQASYIWAYGDTASANGQLGYHFSNKGRLRVTVPNLPNVSPSPSPPVPSPSPSSSSDCSVVFRNQTLTFDACTLGQFGDMNVYYSAPNALGVVDTLFQAPRERDSAHYVSFGWGYSNMVGSIVLSAYVNTGNTTDIGVYSLTSKSSSGVNKISTPSDFTDVAVEETDAFLSGRYKSVPGNGTVSFIWAVGDASDSDSSSLGYHGFSGKGSGKVNFSNVTAGLESTTSSKRRQRVHSVVMAVAWTVLTPWAVIFMRFFKRYNPTTFNVHRFTNFASVVLTVLGLFLVVFTSNLERDPHRFIGYVLVGLAVLQVIGGIFRPAKESGVRSIWYSSHFLLGSIAVGLGFTNVYLGIGLGFFERKGLYYALTSLALGVFVLSYMLLSSMPRRFPIVETRSYGRPSNIGEDDETALQQPTI